VRLDVLLGCQSREHSRSSPPAPCAGRWRASPATAQISVHTGRSAYVLISRAEAGAPRDRERPDMAQGQRRRLHDFVTYPLRLRLLSEQVESW